jgi:exopolyphosphatase/guanosine-5'-triphosphate,3'-diphosphate pyrophosphatase
MKDYDHLESVLKPHRVGVIDMGTNTFSLLIADVYPDRFETIYTDKIGVSIGMGGINKGFIAMPAFRRGLKAMMKFKETCDAKDVAEIRAIATSAIREAINAANFTKEIFFKTNINTKIISGSEEADYIYKGVLWSHNFPERAVIMDIGGGSTEFIFATEAGIEEKISLNIGISRIYQELKMHDPLTEKDVQRIEAWLDDRSNGFFKTKQCDVLVGASGTFETFHEMIRKEPFSSNAEAVEISVQDIMSVLDWSIKSSKLERKQHPFIIPIRRKMAPIAAVKTRWILNQLLVKKVFVSPYSIKEGVLIVR